MYIHSRESDDMRSSSKAGRYKGDRTTLHQAWSARESMYTASAADGS
jgi:hypothetical protein